MELAKGQVDRHGHSTSVHTRMSICQVDGRRLARPRLRLIRLFNQTHFLEIQMFKSLFILVRHAQQKPCSNLPTIEPGLAVRVSALRRSFCKQASVPFLSHATQQALSSKQPTWKASLCTLQALDLQVSSRFCHRRFPGGTVNCRTSRVWTITAT